MAKKRTNLNEGIFEGIVTGLQSVNHAEGKALVFDLVYKDTYTDQTGAPKEYSERLRCCVHPSRVEYLGKKIAEGQKIFAVYQLQVSSEKLPDGTWKNSAYAMITGVEKHINRLYVIGNLTRDAHMGAKGNVAYMTAASNNAFGEDTSFIGLKTFAKSIISLVTGGWLKKGSCICTVGKASSLENGDINYVVDKLHFEGHRSSQNAQPASNGVPEGYTPAPVQDTTVWTIDGDPSTF